MTSSVQFTVLVAVVCVVISTQNVFAKPAISEAQYKQAAKMVRNVCGPKFSISKEQQDSISRGDFTDDQKTKCYMGCMMSTTQMMKGGKLDFKMMKMQAEKMLPPHLRDIILVNIEQCQDKAQGADGCEVAYNFTYCTKQIDPAKFFFP